MMKVPDYMCNGILLQIGQQIEEFETTVVNYRRYAVSMDKAIKWDELKVLRIDGRTDHLPLNSFVIDIVKRAYNLEQVQCRNGSDDVMGAWKKLYKQLCEISRYRKKINAISTSSPSFFQDVEAYVTDSSLDINEYIWQNLKLELNGIHAGFVKYLLKLRR